MKNEYIIYEGEYYTIEWYYNSNSNSSAMKFFYKLDNDKQMAAFKLFQKMADFGKIESEEQFNYEKDKIYAFKPKPNRFLCFFFSGKKIIVTNAFEKKQDKMPPREKEKALSCKKDYENRIKHGEYYE
jgi:hypothetical protein